MTETHVYVVAEADNSRPHKQNMAYDKILAEAKEMSSFLAGMGQRCDAELQEELRVFVQTQGDDGRELASLLRPECARPLWQIGLLGMLANKGLIMLSTDDDCDAQLIALSESVLALAPGLPAPGLPAPAPRPDADARSPYLDTDFESELEALALAVDAPGTDGL